MQVEHITPCIGSEIYGIDLSDPAQVHDHADALRRLLAERQVIFFRDQTLDPAQQVRVAQVFGKVEPVSSTFPSHPDDPHVELLISQGTRTGTDIWHADLTWQTKPPAGACLYAVDVPPTGGDTMWASMTTAFASLAPELQAYLRKLRATHNWEAPALRQSLMRRDPSGESAALIAMLSGLAKVPEWQVRFRWRKGSVAIWDNLATQHYAVNDYHPAARRMHRVAIRQA